MRTLAVRSGRWARILVLAALAVLLVLLPAQSASAHAQLLSSDPADGAQLAAAPSVLTLTFDEAVTPVPEGTQLFAADGTATTLETIARDGVVSAALPTLGDDARYVVTWRVVSADGHPIAGSIRFAVGDPPEGSEPVIAPAPASGVADVAASIAAAGQYLGLLVLAGIVLFELLVLRRDGAFRREGVFGRATRLAGVVAAVSAMLVVPVTAARAAGFDALAERPASVVASITAPTVVGAVLAIIAAAVLWLPAFAGRRYLVAGAAVAALLTPALTGHTALREPAWLMVGSDVVHLLAGAIWLGGLIALVLFLRAAARAGTPAVGAAEVVARFSGWALVAVAALGVSGIVMAILILEDWPALLESSFGRTLLIKLGLVAVVIMLAAVVRRRIVPAITREAGAAAAWRRLRIFLAREAAVLIAVVAVTGLLVNASPTPHTAAVDAPASTSFSASADGVELTGDVVSSAAGETTIAFTLTDADGQPIEPVDPPAVSATLDEQGVGPFAVEAAESGTGQWQAVLPTPVPGEYTVTVGVRLDQFTQRTMRWDVVAR